MRMISKNKYIRHMYGFLFLLTVLFLSAGSVYAREGEEPDDLLQPEEFLCSESEEVGQASAEEVAAGPAAVWLSAEEFTDSYRDQLSEAESAINSRLYEFADYQEVSSLGVEPGREYTFTTVLGEIQDGSYKESEAYLEMKQEIRSDVARAVDAYLKDCLDTYWIRNFQYSFKMSYPVSGEDAAETEKTVRVTEITISPVLYYDGILSEIPRVEEAFRQALGEIDDSGAYDRYTLVKAIYAYVQELGTYASGSTEDGQLHTVTGILLESYEHRCVCEGYAKLLKMLCDAYEIPCVLVIGGSTVQDDVLQVNHMWNVVKMEDGQWYLADATWDDTLSPDVYWLAGSGSAGHDGRTVGENHMSSGIFSQSAYLPFQVPVICSEAYVYTAPAVDNLRAELQGQQIRLSWSPAEGAREYRIYRKTEGESAFSCIASATECSYTDSSAPVGEYCFYRVYPCFPDGDGGLVQGSSGNYVYARVTPEPVSDLRAAPNGKNCVLLTWTAGESAEGYIIYRKTGSEAFSYRGMSSAASFLDTTASDTEFNFYRVYPYTYSAEGKRVLGTSNTYVYAKGFLPSVKGLKAISNTGNVTITWDPVEGADGYIIYRRVGAGSFCYRYIVSGTRFVDTTASKTEYNYYKVYPYYIKNGVRILNQQSSYVYGIVK